MKRRLTEGHKIKTTTSIQVVHNMTQEIATKIQNGNQVTVTSSSSCSLMSWTSHSNGNYQQHPSKGEDLSHYSSLYEPRSSQPPVECCVC
ncbi:hypothetical protein Ae201684_017850 [Aphanomyces euteiches]|uniref:Uncharacterized protein n=1 Tax=Aphanomyces euteiches TaxID=100861 RepID=A0A6G0W9M5_9STRA|nr:hypothetical protein Ae201684_017850 [Aphanomyces euteiches]